MIEGNRGIYEALSANPARLEVITGELGERWETERISIKPYPASAAARRAGCCDEYRLFSEDAVGVAGISAVEVDVHPDSIPIVCGRQPGSAPLSSYSAKFDLAWSVAALLIDGSVTIEPYAADSIGRPEVAELADRVRVAPMPTGGPAADALGGAVITLADGRSITGRVTGSLGTRANPLTEADVVTKFVRNCGADRRPTKLRIGCSAWSKRRRYPQCWTSSPR